jgi:hypothetical protein
MTDVIGIPMARDETSAWKQTSVLAINDGALRCGVVQGSHFQAAHKFHPTPRVTPSFHLLSGCGRQLICPGAESPDADMNVIDRLAAATASNSVCCPE